MPSVKSYIIILFSFFFSYSFLQYVYSFIFIVRSNVVLQHPTSSNTGLYDKVSLCVFSQVVVVDKMVVNLINKMNINVLWIFLRYWVFCFWLDSPHCHWSACLIHSTFKTLTLRIIDRIGLIPKSMSTSVKGVGCRKCWVYLRK